MAKAAGATVVSVTHAAGSALTKEADYTIVHGFEANYAAKLEKMGYVLALAVEILQQVEGFDKYDKMIEGLTNVFELPRTLPTLPASLPRSSLRSTRTLPSSTSCPAALHGGRLLHLHLLDDGDAVGQLRLLPQRRVLPRPLRDRGQGRALHPADERRQDPSRGCRALTFLHRFDALTTVVDAKDYGLGNAVDSSVITYFNPLMHTAVFRVYAEELSYVRQHPLTLRRYMWKLEY